MYGYISRIIHSTAEFIGISDGGSLDPFDLWDINNRFEDLGYRSWFHWGLEDNMQDILNNLILNRPVIVSAGDGFSGHTWVIDGFKYAPKIFVLVGSAGVGIELRNCLMVHCNWGWGGDSDGYFLPYGLSSYNGYQEYDYPENADMEFSYGWMFSTITIKP